MSGDHLRDRTVAIMQPTFLPWVGYFALLDHVDRFILLDDVQFDKRSWQQRNRIKTAQGPQWLTVPVLTKGRRDQTISEVQLQPDAEFVETALRTIAHAYGKAPHYETVRAAIEPAFDAAEDGLCALNIALIEAMAALMEISPDLVRSSETPVHSTKAERLADLCRIHGAGRYVSPPGSRDYLETDATLQRAGIDLFYFQYEHPVWPQLHGCFESYMSALDLVMNALPQSRGIMRSGLRPDLPA